jgi:CHAD domain-containing protein
MSKKIPKTICIFGAQFLLEQVQHLESQIDGVQTGKDIEYVHQMRVASRRLRNGLDLFKECLPGKRSKDWLDDVRNITHALGNARDMDIQIAELTQLYNDELDPKYKPGYGRLLLRLKQRRTKAQKKINKTIYKLQEDDTLSALTAHLSRLVEKAGSDSSFSPALYQKAWDCIRAELNEFLRYESFIREPENIDKLHAMRIAGKHLRYTMEVFAPLYHDDLHPFIILMKNIQDLLGEIHDNDVWVNWLPKFIEKEQARVEEYFGNTGPLLRLLPGLHHLIEDRQEAREKAYQTFLLTWDSIAAENAWQALETVITPPPKSESAPVKEHVDPEFEQEEDGDSEEPGEDDHPFIEIPLTEE